MRGTIYDLLRGAQGQRPQPASAGNPWLMNMLRGMGRPGMARPNMNQGMGMPNMGVGPPDRMNPDPRAARIRDMLMRKRRPNGNPSNFFSALSNAGRQSRPIFNNPYTGY